MDFAVVLGIVGSVASVVGLLIPSQSKRQKLIHVIYGLSIAVIASSAVFYQQKLSRVNQVERAATALISDRRMNFSDEGFVQAALAFLEKNKDLYPDSYLRAQEICKQHQCLSSQYADGAKDSLNHAFGLINAASAMEGLLRGIAEINRGS